MKRNILFNLLSALGLILTLTIFSLVGLWTTVTAHEPIFEGLVLWNKLGSDDEVLHSEVGANGTIIGTSYAYEPAQHGNGYIRKATGQNYVQFPASVLSNLSYRGTIELWITPKVPAPVPYQYGIFGLLGAPYGEDGGVPSACNIYLAWGDTVSGQGLWGSVGFDENRAGTPSEPTQFVATVGVPFHAAISWDIDGIDGTNDKVRVYRNGVVVGSTTSSWNPEGTERHNIILGYSPNSSGFDKYISDNIKVWDYAKSEFNFEESPVPETQLIADSDTLQVYPGDTITVALDIVDATQLYAAQAECNVDPTIIAMQNATFGDFFTNPLIGANLVDAPSGNWLGALSLQNPATPLSGSGNFATLSGQALAPGTTAVACEPLLSDRDGFELPVLYSGLTITVIPFGKITGAATYQGRLVHTNIQIAANGPVAATVTTSANGDFVFDELKAGNYNITADAPLYLPNCTIANVLNGQTTPLGDTTLKGGDVNDDNTINIGDATLVAANFGQTVPPASSQADINADTIVNVQDLAILGGNFGLSGCQNW
ncbi:MAG: hypothetical protein JXA33_25965 [Anaerolineae bacterium]|nr:hypothetical protein [Anaerolineae bacterium]